MRTILFLLSLLAFVRPHNANAQQQNAAAVVDDALQSGDGQTAGSAYAVPGLLWEYVILDRLHLRLNSQRTDNTGADIITAHDSKTGRIQDVWFRAATSAAPDQAETDRVVRTIITSGNGMTPETAFVVGGRIGAEYQILKFMGIKSGLQALLNIRGCSFDRLSGRDIDTNEPRDVYFKLGSTGFDYHGGCVLEPRPK